MLRFLLLLLLSYPSAAQTSLNTTLLDHWKDDNLVSTSSLHRYNECKGFVWMGVEYGMVGSTEGTHFFRLGDDDKLHVIDSVQGEFSSSFVAHRDFAVYKNYAYAVCDEGESSLQIMDLSYLPDSVHVVYNNTNDFARVHNIFIDTANALLYSCLITKKVGGILQSPSPMEVHSLADPINPVLVYTGPSDIPEVHDIYVQDNIAFLNCGSSGLRVYDFTNPASPQFLQNTSFYQDQGYNHQGWLSPDGKTYIFGDETAGKRLKKCSVTNNQIQITSLFGTGYLEGSIPHNIYLSNDFAYVAYYNEGLRIYDIRPNSPVEVAYYDTYPQESEYKAKGAWGVDVLPLSSRILVSDRVNGAFLIDFNEEVFSTASSRPVLIYPNPSETGSSFTIKLRNTAISMFTMNIIDESGRLVLDEYISDQNFYTTNNVLLAGGTYTVRITYTNYLGDEQMLFERLVIY